MNFHGVETKEGWHLGKATETVGVNCYFTESRITGEMGLWACLWESISIVLAEVGTHLLWATPFPGCTLDCLGEKGAEQQQAIVTLRFLVVDGM